MSKTTSGVKPTASITGTARQTGSASRQAGKTASKAGKATHVRKPLTPAQRKRKQERDRRYRARKHGTHQVPGAVPVRQESHRETSVSDCICGSSTEAASNARKWLTEAWSSLRPGERKTQTFAGGDRRIQVEVMRGRPVASVPQTPKVPAVVEPADVFNGIIDELLRGMFRMPVRCGMDFGRGYGEAVCRLVPRALVSKWQLFAEVRSLVDGRTGWLHDSETWEEMA